MTIVINNDFQNQIDNILQDLNKRADAFESTGSGWRIRGVLGLYVNVVKYTPLKGSSYVPLPQAVQNTKCVLNIQNKDNKCFLWSILAALHPVKTHANRVSTYQKYENEIKIKSFPVNVEDIPQIEVDNNIHINVFGYDETVYPLFLSKEPSQEPIQTIDLLLYENHYSLIKRFNGLMYTYSKHGGAKHFCKRCLHCFSSANILANHLPHCSLDEPTRTILPQKGTMMKFFNYKNMLKVPYVVYADFECILANVDDDNQDKATVKYQKHVPCGFKIYVTSIDPKYKSEEISYRGPDADIKFVEKLFEMKDKLFNLVNKPAFTSIKKMKDMSPEQMIEFENATHCHICEEELFDKKLPFEKVLELEIMMEELNNKKNSLKVLEKKLKEAKSLNNKKRVKSLEIEIVYLKGDIIELSVIAKANEKSKVRDHCHVTGNYRGAAHNHCNINFKFDKKNIPVIFHNLKGYDSHLIIKQASKKFKHIECIPQTKDKFSFNLDQFRFIDSMQFMNSSLESLVRNLKDSGLDKFNHLQRFYSGKKLDLLTRKGVYPYDYMNSFDKFDETQLPPQDDFYSQLTKSHISDEDYKHAQLIWDTFNIQNMGEYHDLYLTSDVLLLADVFENFRNTCIRAYKLDPCHYLTAPSLSWDAMLLKTKINLELFSDIETYIFVEKGIRGGISVINHRHAKANNKYMSTFDENKESSFITYLDANALYSWAMSQLLPYGNFNWLSKKEISNLIKDIKHNNLDDSNSGYIFEVDVTYPEELHDLHNEFPLLADNINITDDMLSPYAKNLAEDFELNTSNQPKKLAPNLMDKKNYIIHYKNLLQALEFGLKIDHVHRVLKFDQKPWMKPYIDFNTTMRQNASNAFEKDFYKLMNNSVYGKTMENVRNRIDGRFVNSEKKLNKLVSNPRFKGNPIFYDDDYCFIEMQQTKVTLNKPIYVGFFVLDLSKVLMYDFHYNYIKSKYGDNAQLLFQDTDSLTYHIKTDDLYQEFFDEKDRFDFSDFPKDNKFHCNDNKKVIGKMKMEELHRPISEFIGLRSKMYSILYDDAEEKKTAKGIQKSVKDNEIKHTDYVQVLEEKLQLHHEQRAIRAYDHEIYTIFQNKISLSCYDDKRYILDDGITSYAYGHYNINK